MYAMCVEFYTLTAVDLWGRGGGRGGGTNSIFYLSQVFITKTTSAFDAGYIQGDISHHFDRDTDFFLSSS
jgi:hypothetical protein